MALKNLHIPNRLDTSTANIIGDFFIPMLSASVKYDRGVGFFSSGWLKISAKGMTAFAENGGKARWVTSPILSEEDWNALRTGEEAKYDPILRLSLKRNIHDLETTIETETLSALAWMVADGVLSFKLALPRNKLEQGEFHDKFGIFSDAQGNRVSFNGSYNDSIQGTRNYESIKIFQSWKSGLVDWVEDDAQRFERLWYNEDPNVRVFDLPEAAKEQILKLRKSDRPYARPEWVVGDIGLNKYAPAQPILPDHIVLRDYQSEAISEWFKNDCRGLLEMATGTGKTITALAASAKLFEKENRLAVILAVPYQHLVDQWHQEARAFGYRPTLAYKNKRQWLNKLNTQIADYNAGYLKFISVITTHTTFISSEFQEAIEKLNTPTLLVADEAHHLGAEQSRQNYPHEVPYRLALSATPDRWFDDIGTQDLRGYFGETVFSFPLEKAIGICLTPYYYYPHLVPLTEIELEQYEELTVKIARLMSCQDEAGQSALKMLLIRRAELLNRAENKLSVLSDLVDQQPDIQHTLFYCAPGQIDEVLPLLGFDKGLIVQQFTAEEDTEERKQRLEDFAKGDLQGLVAMKCLDEGVDVPSTKTAYLLASSSNPREFIQRRGRILRKAPDKEFSIVYDLITVPPSAWSGTPSEASFEVERSLIRKELQRFKEFAGPAKNKHQALDVIWEIAKRYSLMDF